MTENGRTAIESAMASNDYVAELFTGDAKTVGKEASLRAAVAILRAHLDQG